MQNNIGAKVNRGQTNTKSTRRVLSKEEQTNPKYTENWINVKKILCKK